MAKAFELKHKTNKNTMYFEDNGGDTITVTAIMSDFIVAYAEELPREQARIFWKWLLSEGFEQTDGEQPTPRVKSKAETIADWKKQIETDYVWAVRSLIRIYEKQTEDEKEIGVTKHHNQVGFTGVDSEILSSFAEQIKMGRSLSPKQRTILHKKMPKYAGQLYQLIKDC